MIPGTQGNALPLPGGCRLALFLIAAVIDGLILSGFVLLSGVNLTGLLVQLYNGLAPGLGLPVIPI